MEPTAKTGPREVFMHLLAIITLYISAISFGTLLFSYVDRFFPDPLIEYYPRGVPGAIRWAIASLIIVFPAYAWLSWVVRRDEAAEPARRELKVRKWLLYFTLFAAGAVIIGDLVALIYNFLGGDLTARFIFKILAVLFIAGLVFAYYLWNLRTNIPALRHPTMRWFAIGVITIVGAATIGGFFLIGSPFQARLVRFDEIRIQHLQEIQWQIVSYWQRKDRLPDTVDQLRDDISGFVPPRDPETGMAYEYRVISPLQFELCAAFKTEGSERGSAGVPQPAFETPAAVPKPPPERESWSHGTGRVCFERTIDPELYRIEKPVR